MSARLYAVNLISGLLPQSRAFVLRRSLYRAAGVNLSPNVRLNGGVIIQNPNVRIGEGTWIGRRTEFAATSRSLISIGSSCDISQDVLFITGSHDIGDSERRAGASDRSLPIEVGNGSWIGARVTMLGGSSIGKGVIVAASSLVRDVFPDNVLIAGTPARIIRYLE